MGSGARAPARSILGLRASNATAACLIHLGGPGTLQMLNKHFPRPRLCSLLRSPQAAAWLMGGHEAQLAGTVPYLLPGGVGVTWGEAPGSSVPGGWLGSWEQLLITWMEAFPCPLPLWWSCCTPAASSRLRPAHRPAGGPLPQHLLGTPTTLPAAIAVNESTRLVSSHR